MRISPFLHIIVLFIFLINTIGPFPLARAQFYLPAPGVMVPLSPPLAPPMLKGIKIDADDPFHFDFILGLGDKSSFVKDEDAGQLKAEAVKLIKYFLASLTIPEEDLWVNLSPYEKNRIIPPSFGLTEMGRDLLAEDYMLKQVTASLIYPEGETGKKFWQRIYQEAAKKFGTTNIPVNTFNKVWIIPDKAVVYENEKAGSAYVVEARLKVMLEQDYLSLKKHLVKSNNTSSLGNQIVREVVIPELTREVNEDKNFTQLRQVYNSLILATWYKKKIRDSVLEAVYADKKKVAGVNINDPQETQKIYQRYLQAFKKGVFNYIKEESDPLTQETIPRKYFSGGCGFEHVAEDMSMTHQMPDHAMEAQEVISTSLKVPPVTVKAGWSRRKFIRTAALAAGALGLLPVTRAEIPSPVVSEKARSLFEPPDNQTLLFIGQDLDSVGEYMDSGETKPAGLSAYSNLDNLEGLTSEALVNGRRQNVQYLIDHYPHTAIQLGLDLGRSLGPDFKDKYEDKIKELADWFNKNKKTPFFLRIGYEFDWPGNNYSSPALYVNAYRYVVDELKRLGVKNVSYVWHSVSYDFGRQKTEDYYPGDKYVDFVGLTYFTVGNGNFAENQLVPFAKEHHKPVMVAEASPWTGQTAKNKEQWYRQFFEFVVRNNVKAIGYISQIWDAETVKDVVKEKVDAKITSDANKKFWHQYIDGARYIKSSDKLFDLLNFDPDRAMSSGAAKPSIVEISSQSEINRVVAAASQWPGRQIYWAAALKDLSHSRAFVVHQDGKFVGLMVMRVGSLTSTSPQIIIDGLEVHQDYQRGGIGRLLVTKAAELSLANKRTQGRVALQVEDQQDQDFYRHLYFDNKKVYRGAWGDESDVLYLMSLSGSGARELIDERDEAMTAKEEAESFVNSLEDVHIFSLAALLDPLHPYPGADANKRELTKMAMDNFLKNKKRVNAVRNAIVNEVIARARELSRTAAAGRAMPANQGVQVTGDKVVITIGDRVLEGTVQDSSGEFKKGFRLEDSNRVRRAEAYAEIAERGRLELKDVTVRPPAGMNENDFLRVILNMFFHDPRFRDVTRTEPLMDNANLKDLLASEYGFEPDPGNPKQLVLRDTAKFGLALSRFSVKDRAMSVKNFSSDLNYWLANYKFKEEVRHPGISGRVFSIALRPGSDESFDFDDTPGSSLIYIKVPAKLSSFDQYNGLVKFLDRRRAFFEGTVIRGPAGNVLRVDDFLTMLTNQISVIAEMQNAPVLKSTNPMSKRQVLPFLKGTPKEVGRPAPVNVNRPRGDLAMASGPGGIDLNPTRMGLQVNKGGLIKFHLDPSQLAQLQNAPGFVPVIIGVKPLNDLQGFLSTPSGNL